jgi:hypothetical protein
LVPLALKLLAPAQIGLGQKLIDALAKKVKKKVEKFKKPYIMSDDVRLLHESVEINDW